MSNAIRKTMKTKSRDEIELSNWIAEYDWDVFGTLTFNKRKLHATIDNALETSKKTAIAENCYKSGFRGLRSYEYIKAQIEFEAFMRYWMKLDKGYFGNNADRQNLRIQRFGLLHKGSAKGKLQKEGKHTHFHFVALSPTRNTNSFIHKLQQVWANDIDISGLSQFVVVYNKDDLSKYLTHEFGNLGTDTIETNTTVLHNRQRYEEITNGYNRHFRHK